MCMFFSYFFFKFDCLCNVRHRTYVLQSHLISYEFRTIEWLVYLTFNHNRCMANGFDDFRQQKKILHSSDKFDSILCWRRVFFGLFFYFVRLTIHYDAVDAYQTTLEHRSQLIAPMGTSLNGRKKGQIWCEQKKKYIDMYIVLIIEGREKFVF